MKNLLVILALFSLFSCGKKSSGPSSSGPKVLKNSLFILDGNDYQTNHFMNDYSIIFNLNCGDKQGQEGHYDCIYKSIKQLEGNIYSKCILDSSVQVDESITRNCVEIL